MSSIKNHPMPLTESTYYSDPRTEMLRYLPKHAGNFLDIGCGAGEFGKEINKMIPDAQITGVEIHPLAAPKARLVLDFVVEKTIEIALDEFEEQYFDCVICNDVLEHLVDPWATLVKIRRILKPSGIIITSLPNARFLPVFKSYILDADWRYSKDGVLDKTHLRFFTQKSIYRLFMETGYLLQTNDGIFKSKLPWKARILNFLMMGKFSDTQYERFASVAKPINLAGQCHE